MKKKVLVIRFSSIGDIVLTSPVVRNLFKAGHIVHYLTKKVFSPILQSNPHIEKVYCIVDEISECVDDLIAENYDTIIDLHNNIRSKMVKRKLSCPSYTFHKLNVKKWLLTNLHIDRLPDLHIVDRYNDTLKGQNIAIDGLGLDYYIPQKEKVDTYNQWDLKSSEYICLAIGAAHYTKRIPIDLAVDILDTINSKLVIIGGKEDRERAQKIISLSSNKGVINACGQFSFHQSASIIKQSAGMIAPDTGMMHIAAALQKPLVCVWGNTDPRFGMYPYYGDRDPRNKKSSIEIEGLSCRPCSKIGYNSCPKKHFKCMNDHKARGIVESLNEMIAEER